MQAFLLRSTEHYFVSELFPEERGCSMCAAGGLAQWLSYCFLPFLVEAEDPLLGHETWVPDLKTSPVNCKYEGEVTSSRGTFLSLLSSFSPMQDRQGLRTSPLWSAERSRLHSVYRSNVHCASICHKDEDPDWGEDLCASQKCPLIPLQ